MNPIPIEEDGGLTSLVQFAQLLSEVTRPEAILPALVESVVTHTGARAAAVLRITDSGELELVASRDLPELAAEEPLLADTIGEELGKRLLKASGSAFARAQTVPLVCGQNLYGALVLFFDGTDVDRGALRLANALVNLASVALEQAHHRERVRRSYEELQASRDSMARVERLRALGEMSAGIAHDLRNIFNPLLLQLGLLKRKAGDPEAVARTAEALELSVRHGVETVERLRLFSHPGESEPEAALDLNTLVNEAIALCAPRLNRPAPRPEVKVELGHPPPVCVRSSELVAALMNLIFNADQAMEGQGTITVSTGGTGGEGWVRVSDNGPGMSKEVRSRVFEPFFTTKGTEGTGLGLAMVCAFVQRSRGAISLESEPGQGACFTLRFPAAAQPSHAPS